MVSYNTQIDNTTFCEKFNTHKATLIQDTDRYLIIDWRKADGSGDYYVNYIVDKKRGSFIVSGDLGDSIATWYNKIKPSNLKNYVKNDIEYYISKIQTASNLFYYDEKNVVESIKYNLKDFDSDEIISSYSEHSSCYMESEDDVWEELEHEVSNCIYGDKFIPSELIVDFCSELDTDYFEWLYDCGKRIHPRVYLWAEGFYRACNQLGI